MILLAGLIGAAGGYSSTNLTKDGVDHADVVVVCPETARVGQLVVLDASESYVDNFKWESPDSVDNFIVIEGGKRAFFSAEKAGTYHFWVAGALDETVDLDHVCIQVDGGGPAPQPVGLEARVRQWLKLVKSENWKSEAEALGASFQSLSAQISAGVIRTPDDVIKATTISNRSALGNSISDWEGFGQELRKELNGLRDAGKLSDMPSHATLWLEIGQILDKVAHESSR